MATPDKFNVSSKFDLTLSKNKDETNVLDTSIEHEAEDYRFSDKSSIDDLVLMDLGNPKQKIIRKSCILYP